jgi:hypothetical protein
MPAPVSPTTFRADLSADAISSSTPIVVAIT